VSRESGRPDSNVPRYLKMRCIMKPPSPSAGVFLLRRGQRAASDRHYCRFSSAARFSEHSFREITVTEGAYLRGVQERRSKPRTTGADRLRPHRNRNRGPRIFNRRGSGYCRLPRLNLTPCVRRLVTEFLLSKAPRGGRPVRAFLSGPRGSLPIWRYIYGPVGSFGA